MDKEYDYLPDSLFSAIFKELLHIQTTKDIDAKSVNLVIGINPYKSRKGSYLVLNYVQFYYSHYLLHLQ
jgi:hypothetical protein